MEIPPLSPEQIGNCSRIAAVGKPLRSAVEGGVPARYMRRAMTKMFKIALPDGSVREMPEGSTPADVAAAIGPGLAKAALAAKVDGEVRDITRPFEGDAEPRAGHLARREGRARAGPPRLRARPRRGGAEPVSRARRSPSARRPTTASITISRRPPGRGPFTDEDLPAIEEEMRRVIAADKPLVREVWDRERVRAILHRPWRDASRPNG